MDSEVFNRFEAGLWLVIAASLGIRAAAHWLRNEAVPYYQSIAALAFAVFGVSDIIESFTGAWWRPWWLVVLKACCVAALVLCYIALRRDQPNRLGKIA
jgi:hypothetical protein